MSDEPVSTGRVKYRLLELPGPSKESSMWIQRRRWFIWKDWIPVVNERRKAMMKVLDLAEKLQASIDEVQQREKDLDNAKEFINQSTRRRRGWFAPRGNISDTWLGAKVASEVEMPDPKKKYDEVVKRFRLLDWIRSDSAKAKGPSSGPARTAYFPEGVKPPGFDFKSDDFDHVVEWKNQSRPNRGKGQQQNRNQQNQG